MLLLFDDFRSWRVRLSSHRRATESREPPDIGLDNDSNNERRHPLRSIHFLEANKFLGFSITTKTYQGCFPYQ